MRQNESRRLAVSAGIAVSVVDAVATTPASASKVRVANSRVQQLLILMRAIAAGLPCGGLPSRAFAQAGESSVAIAALPQDLSPWGMFLHANTIVKAVMIGLAVASLVTWTVWVAQKRALSGRSSAQRAFSAIQPRRERK